ncbi:hypothetical protein GCM10011533_10360 [Streptosporangium jomthongense]|uniref:DUF3080 domain-containing protein n=1 Tax=Marinobacter aromaticivorans TaxID=1494078 RepID=A0ABW2IT07_9GAMM|nr:hypothetical protein [Marinobacter aromaticivorans]GGE59682.1 hypothetical protein GCM10011533_10360 [Streptosporangium jomthongense]
MYKMLGLMFLAGLLVLSGCDSGNGLGNTGAGDSGADSTTARTLDSSGDISLALEPAQLDWVGQKIFQNECAGQFQCLVHWNEAEAFPSLGIGHFIWYPRGVDGRFVESFPALIEYMEQRQLNIPEWLRELEPFDAPWPDRETFLKAADSPEMAELREFLAGTQGVQAEFIFRRAKASMAKIVQAALESRREDVQQKLRTLSQTPGGVYALMDYVNFKGEGLSPNERYNGDGWGLLQVLLAMPVLTDATESRASDTPHEQPDEKILTQFREAAAAVLTRRARNADKPVERESWLAGWLKRLETYKEPVEMGSVSGVSS